LNQADIDAKVKEMQEALTRQRKSRIPAEVLAEEIGRSMVGSYILGRIAIVPLEEIQQPAADLLIEKMDGSENSRSLGIDVVSDIDNTEIDQVLMDNHVTDSLCRDSDISHRVRNVAYEIPTKIDFEVRLQAITGDGNVDYVLEGLDYVLDGPPEGLEPIFIPRKKKTTHEDFKESLRSFKTDTRSLSTANARAGKLAGLAKMAVEGFRASGRYYDEDLYSQAQIRWMKACHRIVVQNDVEKYRKMLDEMYGNQSNQSDASKRFSMKNARASFPVDAKYLPRSLEDDEHLPPVDGERNIYNELVNSEGKKIVKVMSKYSKGAAILQSHVHGKLPEIKISERRNTFGAY
jgi:hypothetical protein